jgi:hypothetical protein
LATATELLYEEQMIPVRQIGAFRGWELEEFEGCKFIVGMKARDGSQFWQFVDCEDYQAIPPAFNWYNPEGNVKNHPSDTPNGGSFFHPSGRICAPWNRLAYQQEYGGPHKEWQLSNWMSNPNTGGTRTLMAMLLRIYRELQSPEFKGRMG